MNTYPKIINCDGNIGLLTNEEFGISLSGLPNASYGIWTLKGENITREYLANTYGEVKNGEHADFIVKLAESAGFELHSDGVSMSSIKSFVIYGDEKLIGIYTMKVGHLSTDESYKEITIPLPPKEPEPKEWPQVGEDVSFPSGFGVVAIAKPDSSGVIIIESKNADSKGEYKRVALSAITKPTHEETLRNELQNTLADSSDVIGAVNLLMSKYDIKKKPE